MKLRSQADLEVDFFPLSDIEPGISSSKDQNREQKTTFKRTQQAEDFLPIEEGLFALTMQPFDVVKLKVMAIAMSRIDLFARTNRKNYEKIRQGKKLVALNQMAGSIDLPPRANAVAQVFEPFRP